MIPTSILIQDMVLNLIHVEFSSCLSQVGLVKKVVTFAADMGSSVHTGNKKKDILILAKGQADGLDDTTWPGEK